MTQAQRERQTISSVMTALQASWTSETGYGGESHPDNPSRGQCVVSSLVMQDYFGGDLIRVRVTIDGVDEKHYFNKLPSGLVIDTTRSQYIRPVTMVDAPIDLTATEYANVRERCLSDIDTRRRYQILAKSVRERLSE